MGHSSTRQPAHMARPLSRLPVVAHAHKPATRCPRTQRPGQPDGPARRARGDHTPVLVLSALDSTEERIARAGRWRRRLGKPYELKKRWKPACALLQRAGGTADIVVGQLVLDREACVSVAGQPLELPAREFGLLWELMTPPGRVLSKGDLSLPVGRRWW